MENVVKRTYHMNMRKARYALLPNPSVSSPLSAVVAEAASHLTAGSIRAGTCTLGHVLNGGGDLVGVGLLEGRDATARTERHGRHAAACRVPLLAGAAGRRCWRWPVRGVKVWAAGKRTAVAMLIVCVPVLPRSAKNLRFGVVEAMNAGRKVRWHLRERVLQESVGSSLQVRDAFPIGHSSSQFCCPGEEDQALTAAE